MGQVVERPKSTHPTLVLDSLYCHQYSLSRFHPRTHLYSEYQSEFGAEAVTQSELAREWISAMVRPGSKLMRVRVDAVTSAVKAIEHKTLQQLTKDGLPLGFKPAEQLGNLHSLFSRYSVLCF